MDDLLSCLYEAGLSQELEVILEPLMPENSKVKDWYSQHPDASIPSDWNMEAHLEPALLEVVKHDFLTPLYPGMCAPCNLVQDRNFVIDWNGNFSRCTFTMTDADMQTGSVFDGTNARYFELTGLRAAIRSCLNENCAYLPFCAGSCRYRAWFMTGDFRERACPVELWDRLLPLSIAHFFKLQPLRKSAAYTDSF